MIVEKINLKNFRSYSSLSASFTPGLNIITGENASGKTNLVEAIYYISLARSFRTSEDSELLLKGALQGSIDAWVVEGLKRTKIRVLISPSGKKIAINNKPITRLSELSDVANVIVFQPKDVLLFKDAPRTRRQFLDVNILKTSSTYLEAMNWYDTLLKERNELLKQEKPNLDQLDIITNQLIEVGLIIVRTRTLYISRANEIISKVASQLKGRKDKVQIVYFPYAKPDEDYENHAKSLYKECLESDMKHKTTSVGIHREDFILKLNGENIAEYGSQGENRMMAIALKLVPYFLVSEKDKRPVVVLDDVMSELDKNHQSRLIRFLSKFEQVFITTTKSELHNVSTYYVSDHKITRRN